MEASGERARRPWAALLVLAFGAWSGAVLRGGFAYDDREAIVGNPAVEGTVGWSELFLRDYWAHHPAGAAGHYRPLATVSLRLDRALWGAPGSAPGKDRAAGYHATNVALHLAVLVLAAALAASTAGGRWPWFGLALFAVHPALADSVAWISGRTSMLSALGGLAGALAAAHLARRRGVPAIVATGAAAAAGVLVALLGKEDGIVFAPLAVLVAGRASRRGAVAATVGSVAAIGAYLALRHATLGQWLPAAPQAPLADAPLAERLRIAGGALTAGLRLAVWPFGQPPSLELADLAPTSWAVAALAWLALLTALAGGTWLARRPNPPNDGANLNNGIPDAVVTLAQSRSVGASLALAALAVLPLMQLVPSGELFAPRFLYLPLLLGAPFVHAAWTRVWGAGHRGVVLGGALCLACVPLAWRAAGPYTSRAAYWEAHLPQHERSPSVWNALGNARREAGDDAGAQAAWERAVALDPTYSRPWNNLATLAIEAGDLPTAEELLRRAVAAGPANASAWANLGNVLLRRDESAASRDAYERAVELSPDAAPLWRGLARARQAAGDRDGARAAVEEALRLDPGDARAAELARELAGEHRDG